jgi:hyperosmotically inducible periplasmic protein
MNPPRRLLVILVSATILFSSGALVGRRAFAQSDGSKAAPDNTKTNKDHAQTADSQSNSKTDREITASARKALLADKRLSTYTHNIKVITVNGMVTLKGPVKSAEEKQKITSDISSIVSSDKITNELTIKQ